MLAHVNVQSTMAYGESQIGYLAKIIIRTPDILVDLCRRNRSRTIARVSGVRVRMNVSPHERILLVRLRNYICE